MQNWSAAHATPTLAAAQSSVAPQNARSVCGSMQLSPQSSRPAAQRPEHLPATHDSAVLHATPAFAAAQSPVAPQNAAFVVGSMHFPPHATKPVGQFSTHFDAAQTSPAPHFLSHAPQWFSFVVRSTHWVPQFSQDVGGSCGVSPTHAPRTSRFATITTLKSAFTRHLP